MGGMNLQMCPTIEDPVAIPVDKFSGAEHCMSILYWPGVKKITLHICSAFSCESRDDKNNLKHVQTYQYNQNNNCIFEVKLITITVLSCNVYNTYFVGPLVANLVSSL